MRNPLGKNEITGLILLAILIVVITGCALFVKGCNDTREGSLGIPAAVIEVLDTVPLPAPTSSRPVKKAVKKATPRKRRQQVHKKPIRQSDPFSDTIPTY